MLINVLFGALQIACCCCGSTISSLVTVTPTFSVISYLIQSYTAYRRSRVEIMAGGRKQHTLYWTHTIRLVHIALPELQATPQIIICFADIVVLSRPSPLTKFPRTQAALLIVSIMVTAFLRVWTCALPSVTCIHSLFYSRHPCSAIMTDRRTCRFLSLKVFYCMSFEMCP